jgi:ornithine cyclodeaminase/alanine dehydrogenase-like protein (mu-crystallin family)
MGVVPRLGALHGRLGILFVGGSDDLIGHIRILPVEGTRRIGNVLTGKKFPRESDDEIIYFNAVGAGILDIAVAARCYKKALSENTGIKVPFRE